MPFPKHDLRLLGVRDRLRNSVLVELIDSQPDIEYAISHTVDFPRPGVVRLIMKSCGGLIDPKDIAKSWIGIDVFSIESAKAELLEENVWLVELNVVDTLKSKDAFNS